MGVGFLVWIWNWKLGAVALKAIITLAGSTSREIGERAALNKSDVSRAINGHPRKPEHIERIRKAVAAVIAEGRADA